MKKDLQTAFNSRQFMVARDFELYYYNDTQYVQIAPHTHPYYEFYFFLEGEADYELEEKTSTLSFGDFIVVPPGIRHRAAPKKGRKSYRRFVFWVKEEYLQRYSSVYPTLSFLREYLASPERRFIFHQDSVTFNSILRDIMALLEEMHHQRYGREDTITIRTLDLLMHLNRMVHDSVHPPLAQEEKGLYINVSEYVENHLEDELSLESLAREFFVSKYHLAHNFKDNLGISVHQYILKKRLQACRNAIIKEGSVTRVYSQYGFHDYPGFYRAFKKEFGISPKEYLKQALAITRATSL